MRDLHAHKDDNHQKMLNHAYLLENDQAPNQELRLCPLHDIDLQTL